jgi:hypothetical protein
MDNEQFPGEDRQWGGRVLYVDLIPASCWFTNARSVLSEDEWHALAKKIRERADFDCEICGQTYRLRIRSTDTKNLASARFFASNFLYQRKITL